MSRRECKLAAFAAKVRGFCVNVEDEVQEHLKLLAERFVAEEMSREEAAAAARRQFGNVTLLQEERRELRLSYRSMRYGRTCATACGCYAKTPASPVSRP